MRIHTFAKGTENLTKDEINYLKNLRKNEGEGIFHGKRFICKFYTKCEKSICKFCVLKDYKCNNCVDGDSLACIDKTKYNEYIAHIENQLDPEGLDGELVYHFTPEELDYIHEMRMKWDAVGVFRGQKFLVTGALCECTDCEKCVLNGFPCELTNSDIQDGASPCEKIN